MLAGPLCTQVLGDLGADVVKVERPGGGDDTRHWGPPFAGDDAAYFLSLNRNKRSITVDLTTPEGMADVKRLADSSDVLIENFRPGLMSSFGLGLDDLRATRPELVTCSLTAFGDDAPDTASRPGYDIIVQALSGLMSVTGEPDGEPVKTGVALLDVVTGLYAAVGILAALHDRSRTGRGRHVAVALYDASLAAMVNQAANHLIGGLVPGRLGTAHPNIVPYQAFHAADRPFILAAGNDRLFRRTCEVLERADLADDERFASNEQRVRNRDALVPVLEEEFAARPASRWLELLDAAAVPCAPIRGMDEVFASPEGMDVVEEVEDPGRGEVLRLVRSPIRFDGEPIATRSPPPSSVSTPTRCWVDERRGGLGIRSAFLGDPGGDPRGRPRIAVRVPCRPVSTPRRGGGGGPASPTTERALEVLPEAGSVLDVGVGGGGTSLPLAGHASEIIGVDSQGDMLVAFVATAERAGVRAATVAGRWPDVKDEAPVADVVVCGHVAYNVADLEPFVRALDEHARLRVVLELTDRHPLVWMNDLWLAFHGVRRPEGPSADDAVALLAEMGIVANREDLPLADDPAGNGFPAREDAIALVRRRLCLGSERDGDIAIALGDRLHDREGLWTAGPPHRSVVTLWWDTG